MPRFPKDDGPETPTPSATPDPMAKARVRFTHDHVHAGMPFSPGDEILIESHWAESIERLGTGQRITDTEHKE